jgi:Tfp pilus assembly protein PilF
LVNRLKRAIGMAALVPGMVMYGFAAKAHFDQPAVKLNNQGVAQMGQQLPDRAAQTFAEAIEKDPSLVQAFINEGIALLALQRKR